MGSQDELLAVFRRNEPMLKLYLKKVSGSHSEAEDLAQEAWIKLARNGAAALASPLPYLMRIARTISIDYHRTNRNRLNSDDIAEYMELADESADPYREVAGRDQIRRLLVVIEELPPRQRDMLRASRLQNRNHGDIARDFGVTVRTVESEIRKALAYCSDRLAK